MPIQSFQEAFAYDLASRYDAEHVAADLLLMLTSEVDDDQLKGVFQHHERETRQQIQNLEQCFRVCGIEPRRVICHALFGLTQDHDLYLREDSPPEILMAFDLGIVSRAEHFEIAAYRNLIATASLMGQSECVRLLQQNLEQEEAMARQVEQVGRECVEYAIRKERPRAA